MILVVEEVGVVAVVETKVSESVMVMATEWDPQGRRKLSKVPHYKRSSLRKRRKKKKRKEMRWWRLGWT